MDMSALTATAVSGGVFGMLGSVAGRVAGYFEKRQSYRQEEKRWAHESALLELQMKAKAAETEQEVLLANTSGGWDGLKASLDAEGRIGESYKWVHAVRALTRPVLTLLLWVMTALVFFASSNEALTTRIADTITFAATAATLWWFGDRALPHKGR